LRNFKEAIFGDVQHIADLFRICAMSAQKTVAFFIFMVRVPPLAGSQAEAGWPAVRLTPAGRKGNGDFVLGVERCAHRRFLKKLCDVH
jgi:hypothetical protein